MQRAVGLVQFSGDEDRHGGSVLENLRGADNVQGDLENGWEG
jgi:hypothetical protein